MAVDLLTGEKVLYTKDYVKGRSRTVGTVIVTDKRVISTVESKRSTERTEIRLDEVGGVLTRFRPASLAPFITCFMALVVGAMLIVTSNNYSGAFSVIYKVIGSVGMLIIIITAMLQIRSGLNVVIFTRGKEINLVSAAGISGKARPIRLKTDKNSAQEIAHGISAAIKSARAV